MEWLELILSAIGGSVVSLVGSIVYFRPKLAEAKAGASKAQTEADDARLNYLLGRIEASEKLYTQQGEMLNDLRIKQLNMEKELHEKNERIIQLEAENKELTKKVDQLDREVQAYRTITGK